VLRPGDAGRPSFVLALLDAQRWLVDMSDRRLPEHAPLALHLLGPHPPLLLAAGTDGEPPRPSPQGVAAPHRALPIFAFGRALLLTIGSIERAHGRHTDSWPLALFGVISTALLALLLDVLGNRRRALESEVETRTAELRESEHRLERLIAAAHDAIIMVDSAGRVCLWNDTASRTFGYTREEALGQPLHPLIAPDSASQAGAGLRSFAESGEGAAVGKTLELDARRRSGETFPVELSLAPLQLHGEWHAIGIVRDITERRRAEEALRQHAEQLAAAKQAAEAADAAKSQFLANMSHEIRTPLNGILGMAALLQESPLDPEQREHAALLRRSGQLLLSLVNDILDFSKIEAGRLELELADFGVRAAIEDVAAMLRLEAASKGLRLTTCVDPALPRRLRGDPLRLRQVIANLGKNAVKFSASGEVRIEAALEADLGHGARVRVTVTDQGIGIPAAKLGSLFSPFTQADGSITRRFGGTGLGLAISKQLVEMMGGAIGVESEEGKGSRFWFSVALAHSTDASASSTGTHRAVPALPPTVEELASRRGGRVLVADDNEVNRVLVSKILERLGYRAVVVENGQQALAALRAQAVDAILMDCQMPELDGYEATRRIRAGDAPDPRVPIVALTAHALAGVREQCLAAGMDDYVSKPIDPRRLDEVLQRLLDREAGDASPPAAPETTPGQATHEVEAVVFDEADLLARIMGDRDLARLLAAGFLADLPQQVGAVRAAVDAHDSVAAGKQAHKLRGASVNLSCHALAGVAASMEQAGESGDLARLQALLPRLEAEAVRLREELALR